MANGICTNPNCTNPDCTNPNCTGDCTCGTDELKAVVSITQKDGKMFIEIDSNPVEEPDPDFVPVDIISTLEVKNPYVPSPDDPDPLPSKVVKYVSDITGRANLKKVQSYYSIPSLINVDTTGEEVVEYQGFITGLAEIEYEPIEPYEFYSSLDVPGVRVDYGVFLSGRVSIKDEVFNPFDLNSQLYVPKIRWIDFVDGFVKLESYYYNDYRSGIRGKVGLRPNIYDNYMMQGKFEYVPQDLTTDIISSIYVIYPYDNKELMSGVVKIDPIYTNTDIYSLLKVDSLLESHEIDGSVQTVKTTHTTDVLDGGFDYRESGYSEDLLEGNVIIHQWNQKYEILSSLLIPRYDYIYSILSQLTIAPGVNYDMDSFLKVVDRFKADLLRTAVRLDFGIYRNDDLLTISAVLPPFEYMHLNGMVNLNKVGTRKDLDSSLIVVNGLNKDINSTLEVETPYQQYSTDIPSSLNVGELVYIDFDSVLEVDSSHAFYRDINSSVNVRNYDYAGRIGIFVDPLWKYEPYVLKNAVSTFLDRLYEKHKITLVYGGSPRANWDIHKFGDIYGVNPSQLIEVPYSFVPGNNILNVDQMNRYVRALFSFNNDSCAFINKVFVFSDSPYAHNTTYLAPLFKMCEAYHIPMAVITSKGDVVGTDPSTGKYGTQRQINLHYPLTHQPHWVYGEGSKHRDVFDDGGIV